MVFTNMKARHKEAPTECVGIQAPTLMSDKSVCGLSLYRSLQRGPISCLCSHERVFVCVCVCFEESCNRGEIVSKKDGCNRRLWSFHKCEVKHRLEPQVQHPRLKIANYSLKDANIHSPATTSLQQGRTSSDLWMPRSWDASLFQHARFKWSEEAWQWSRFF